MQGGTAALLELDGDGHLDLLLGGCPLTIR